MTAVPSGADGRWARWARPCVLVGVVVVLLVASVGLIGLYSVLLDRTSRQVEQAQSRSANLANVDREALILLQTVTALGRDGDPDEIDIRRGIVGRQLVVSSAAFEPGDPQITDLQEVRAQLAAFPWERLVDGGGSDDGLRRAATALVTHSEERINGVRSKQEQHFYAVTTASLAANQRGQFVLATLVALVLVLGAGGIALVLHRSRSDVARAYAALKGEVEERRVAEEALRASEGRFRSLVQRASDLTIVTDDQGVVNYASPSVEAFVGHRPADLHGRSLLDYVEPDERAEVAAGIALLAAHPGLLTIELQLCTRDGRVRSVEAVCQNLVDDPDVAGLVWNGRDVTERRVLEDELTHRAHHDPLTGLPNRALLLRSLDETLAASTAARGRVAVAVIDLDGFKNVNDTLGHPAGDELLRVAARRLLGCVRDGDVVARLGGDEFAVLITGPDRAHATAVARRMVDVLHEPLVVAGHEVTVGASIGVAYGAVEGAAEDLLRDADIAMYVAKRTGKGRVAVFEPAMRVEATHRTRLQQELAQAVERGEIEVVYQPIVDLRTGCPVQMEALARWNRPGRPPVPAEVFIAIAEESGAIDTLGAEVLRQACHAAAGWRHLPGYAELGVAVNVSVHQIRSGQLVDQVAATLRAGGLPPAGLVLEITETAALDDCDRIRAELARLPDGVRIAVDDFGAGYTSLGLLTNLDVDGLKIDRSLLDFDTTRRGSLVAAITELGHTLGLRVVAEGVETAGHLHRAREAGCDSVQGFHLARPLPAGAVAAFLTAWTGAPLGSGPTVTRS